MHRGHVCLHIHWTELSLLGLVVVSVQQFFFINLASLQSKAHCENGWAE